MEKTKVLFVSQEIAPYLPESQMSKIGRFLPQGIQEKGSEIRTFMPRYGCINERRNQLHEVIRLSGMNLIINDMDHPLIIKVASIQSARMQVYFIDNEDLFHRKHILCDSNEVFFKDNDERAIFFARGVLETVKKLRWAPDIVHCHGWITSMVPMYIKRAFKEDPLFSNSRVIYSLYDDYFDTVFDKKFKDKVHVDGVSSEDVEEIKKVVDYNTTTKLAIQFSDGIIMASNNISPNIRKHLNTLDKPILEYQDDENYVDSYSDFYDKILTGTCVETV
ncbi:MAG: glycogen synthase [Bacteroidetes bacterium GWA2_30_7]|nr:MAG: glycogen synthase [Bacteroidetes bacterium GWA2_30_7]